MSDILEEASSVIECQQCSWYKACVMPMRFSIEDMRRELQQAMPGTSLDPAKENELYNMLTNTAAVAQSMLLEGCPVFVKRLKLNPRLAERLKKMMQEWGTESP